MERRESAKNYPCVVRDARVERNVEVREIVPMTHKVVQAVGANVGIAEVEGGEVGEKSQEREIVI